MDFVFSEDSKVSGQRVDGLAFVNEDVVGELVQLGHPGLGPSSKGAEAPVGEHGSCGDSRPGPLSPLQLPKGVDRASSICGAGARHGQGGAASLCCLWLSWPGCSGQLPIWHTSHSAPVLTKTW